MKLLLFIYIFILLYININAESNVKVPQYNEYVDIQKVKESHKIFVLCHFDKANEGAQKGFMDALEKFNKFIESDVKEKPNVAYAEVPDLGVAARYGVMYSPTLKVYVDKKEHEFDFFSERGFNEDHILRFLKRHILSMDIPEPEVPKPKVDDNVFVSEEQKVPDDWVEASYVVDGDKKKAESKEGIQKSHDEL